MTTCTCTCKSRSINQSINLYQCRDVCIQWREFLSTKRTRRFQSVLRLSLRGRDRHNCSLLQSTSTTTPESCFLSSSRKTIAITSDSIILLCLTLGMHLRKRRFPSYLGDEMSSKDTAICFLEGEGDTTAPPAVAATPAAKFGSLKGILLRAIAFPMLTYMY